MLISMKVFGKRLKEIREFKGMTRWERSPTAESIARIAQVFDLSADYLIRG